MNDQQPPDEQDKELVRKLTKREQRAADNLKYCLEKYEAQRPYRGWFKPKNDQDGKDAKS